MAFDSCRDFVNAFRRAGGLWRVVLLLFVILWGGCSTRRTASLAAKTVTTTGSIAGKTVLGTGKMVAKSAVAVTKAGIGAGAGVTKTAVVTFVDLATGVTRQLPYAEGMKLYAASKTAELDLVLKSIQILRGSQVIQTPAKKLQSGKTDLSLLPGDIIRLSKPGV